MPLLNYYRSFFGCFDDAASLTVAGIDLSAGTTQDSVIDNSADTTAAKPMMLKGGLGRNTIKGGSGADVIIGEDKNDSLMGNAGGDRIATGAGRDTVAGGDDNDTIVMDTNLTNQDSITGGVVLIHSRLLIVIPIQMISTVSLELNLSSSEMLLVQSNWFPATPLLLNR